MTDFQKLIDEAVEVRTDEGAVDDTLAELRTHFASTMDILLDRQFDLVCQQYMRLTHDKGLLALGQAMSAVGLALFDLDGEDIHCLTILPETQRDAFQAFCEAHQQACKLLRQSKRSWGEPAKPRRVEKVMPCDEYRLEDDTAYDYFFNSLAGNYASGEWKPSESDSWMNGCFADLRHRPPRVVRSRSHAGLCNLSYSPDLEVYAASRATPSKIGRVMVGKNPSVLNFFEPSQIGYDDAPQSSHWVGSSLWIGDPCNVTQIELTENGTSKAVHNWILPKDGWAHSYHAGIVSDGLGRVYFSNEWYQGKIYRWEAGKVVEHPFKLSGYDHLSDAVPVPGTSHIFMIHCVSGRGRIDPCLLDLDMDTGRCRIAGLPGIGEGVRCRWLTRDWLLLQAHGESRAYDSAQLINMTTREVLRIKPGMFGEDRFQHLGILPDGTVVIVVRRHLVGPVFLYPKDFWGFLRESGNKRQLEPWRDYEEHYPNIPFVLPNRSTVSASSEVASKACVICADWLMRPIFDTLSVSKRTTLMEHLAARYGLNYLGLETFEKWGQCCVTGRFQKDGREFVFVPGASVTLGWDRFVLGLNRESQAELDYLREEWEIEQSPEEMICETMSPVRQSTIGPMLVARKLETLCWEPVKLGDSRLASHPDWLNQFREFIWSDLDSLTLHKSARIERTEKGFEIAIYNSTDYDTLHDGLAKQGLALPTVNEWAYLCGGGCRTLFPWGDGMDYAMRLHHFESAEDEDKPFDMEEPNFFGLSIAYDPYKREVVEADTLTTCGGDGGRNICGGLGILLGYLPCSPHAKPHKHDSDELNGDFDFYRPIIRIDLFESDVSQPPLSGSTKFKTVGCNDLNLEAYFDQTVNGKSSLTRLSLGELECSSGSLVACDPCTSLMDAKPFLQRIPPGRYPLTMAVSVSDTLGVRYACAKLSVSDSKPVRYELGLCCDENSDEALKKGEATGFSVDTGLATLTDVITQNAFASYWKQREAQEEGIDPYNDLFADLLEENAAQYPQYQSPDGDWCAWTAPETNRRLVVFTSGLGDGVYPTYFGYDANGQVCGVYVPFVDLDQC